MTMLKHLHIRNLALIESLDLDMECGFSVVTGETGAGKSIIMGALGLVMGDRADVRSVRVGANKSVVEATFLVSDNSLAQLFEQLGLDYFDECIIRREVLASGKSRAFINDTPVNQAVLRSVSSHLIDIHSQYENLLLNNADFQLEVVDVSAHVDDELEHYRLLYKSYNEAVAQLDKLKNEASKSQTERDYLQFQFDQLNDADIKEDEQEILESELQLLNHIEEVKTDLSVAVELMENDEYGVMSRIKEAVNRVDNSAKYLPEIIQTSERLASLFIDLKDIDAEIASAAASLEYDPARKFEVEQRLDTIYSLEQKHHVSSCSELVAIFSQLSEKLSDIDNYDEQISTLYEKMSCLEKEMSVAADKLSEKRSSVSDEIAGYLTGCLVDLGMPNAVVQVAISKLEQYTSSGRDDVRFMFTANKNMPLRPIADVASGGEIARVMLALKALTVRKSHLSTIIFDEVDTGVSGDIAQRMGLMMSEMSKYIQVISITHLPQIAAAGDCHYKVYKTDSDTATTTHIMRLTNELRVLEIAEMLSGKNPSDTAKSAAAELLNFQ